MPGQWWNSDGAEVDMLELISELVHQLTGVWELTSSSAAPQLVGGDLAP